MEIETLEYIGQFWVEFEPTFQLNGLENVSFVASVRKDTNATLLHFKWARVVLPPDADELSLYAGDMQYSLPKSKIVRVFYPGGIFFKQPVQRREGETTYIG
ncbi:MAG: hypothetical protein HYT37_02415 [Candidatus Sungbacteria bacterium]|nr:hypothetical protein [Candidatus Sungbacteria bacterium]